MIPRTSEQKLRELAGYYPVVVVTGLRQSGKATLCQLVFPAKTYVSLEALDTREFALSDPRGFLAQLRGAIFESWVISEIYKASVHLGLDSRFFHYRETRGLEIDLLVEQGGELDAVEIKSGATTSADFFRNLERFPVRLKDAGKKLRIRSHIVYGGDDSQHRSRAQVISWRDVQRLTMG
jgi:predicted AAA+ superfamily ATPase